MLPAHHLELEEDNFFPGGEEVQGAPSLGEERLGFIELDLERVRKHFCSAEILGILWSS